jgi:hypothetical protein
MIVRLAVLLTFLALSRCVLAQESIDKPEHSLGRAINSLAPYLDLAETTAARFRPLTQAERTRLYLKGVLSPWGVLYGATRAGLHQSWNGPPEWGQGAQGYGKRFADSYGQYWARRTFAFSFASVLHEDNRYFRSGKHGLWRRTKYAVASGLLARHDNGQRSLSISRLGAIAGVAFVSRTWQPPSTNSAGDAAVSFGVTMGTEVGLCVFKEFLPELAGPLHRKVR